MTVAKALPSLTSIDIDRLAEAVVKRINGKNTAEGIAMAALRKVQEEIDEKLRLLVEAAAAASWNETAKIHAIISATAEVSGLPAALLLSERRSTALVRARQIAMHVAKERCPHASLPVIGRLFRRDHTTVLHACRVVAERLETDPETRDLRDRIVARLEAA